MSDRNFGFNKFSGILTGVTDLEGEIISRSAVAKKISSDIDILARLDEEVTASPVIAEANSSLSG